MTAGDDETMMMIDLMSQGQASMWKEGGDGWVVLCVVWLGQTVATEVAVT